MEKPDIEQPIEPEVPSKPKAPKHMFAEFLYDKPECTQHHSSCSHSHHSHSDHSCQGKPHGIQFSLPKTPILDTDVKSSYIAKNYFSGQIFGKEIFDNWKTMTFKERMAHELHEEYKDKGAIIN